MSVMNREWRPPGPHGWIQWKGTSVCMDVHCACGAHGHVDADFAYTLKCKHAALGRRARVGVRARRVRRRRVGGLRVTFRDRLRRRSFERYMRWLATGDGLWWCVAADMVGRAIGLALLPFVIAWACWSERDGRSEARRRAMEVRDGR